jgi:hypothetical protein
MAAVGKLTQLENFRTWHTYQTEKGNAALRSLTNLKSLHLGQRLRKYDGSPNEWSLSDATLDVLAEIPSLEVLLLDEAQFTVPALGKLKSLPNLKRLELGKVELSADDLAALKKALPGVEVVWKPLTDDDRRRLEQILKK